MYSPQHFEETRLDVLHDLIRSHPLGTLVILAGTELSANHIPFLIHPDEDGKGTLCGHVSRANPVWRQLGGNVEALVVFQGPSQGASRERDWHQEPSGICPRLRVHAERPRKPVEAEHAGVGPRESAH